MRVGNPLPGHPWLRFFLQGPSACNGYPYRSSQSAIQIPKAVFQDWGQHGPFVYKESHLPRGCQRDLFSHANLMREACEFQLSRMNCGSQLLMSGALVCKSPESGSWVSLIWELHECGEGRSGVTNISINIYCDCLWRSLNFPVIWLLPTSPGASWSKFIKDSFRVSSNLTFPVTLFWFSQASTSVFQTHQIYVNNPMLMKWSVCLLVHQPHCTVLEKLCKLCFI